MGQFQVQCEGQIRDQHTRRSPGPQTAQTVPPHTQQGWPLVSLREGLLACVQCS